MHDTLPPSTLRDLGAILAALAAMLLEKAARILSKLRPFAEPPDDLKVHSTRGASYSGGIVIDENEVIGGVVVRVGQRTPAAPPVQQRPLIPPDPYDRRDRQFLRGWAEDPREEDDAWPPRSR